MQSNQFPTVQQAVFLLLANFLLQYLIGAAMHDMQGMLHLTQYQQSALAALLGDGILLAFVTHYQGRTYSNLIHPSRSSKVATFVLIGPTVVLFVPFLILVNVGLFELLIKVWPLARWEEEFFGMFKDGGLAAVVYAAILAPVLEEMLFRGVLLRSFLTRYPRWPAIAISALLFGFAHLNIYQFLLAFPMGLLLGWLFERSNSLIPSITLHAAFNAVSVALNLSVRPESELRIAEFSAANWLVSIAAFAIGAWALRVIFRVRPISESETMKSGREV